MRTQPKFIDCQQELLQPTRFELQQKCDWLIGWVLAFAVVAICAVITLGIVIYLR